MPGEQRPVPRAADAAAGAARAHTAERLARAMARLDGLFALLGVDDARDAALLSSLLAEDLDAVAAALGLVGVPSLVADRADLGPLPPAEALAAFAHRAEAALTRLETAFTAKKAGAWRLPADRFEARALWRVRVLLVVCVVFLAASILLGDVIAHKRREYAAMHALERDQAKASLALSDLSKMALAAKRSKNKALFAITGENCSRCGCEGRDLRTLAQDDICRRKWDATRLRMGQAAGASPQLLASLASDPWGSPYLLHEDPDFPCLPDIIFSAGANGILGDADDLGITVPNAFCPEPQ